MTIKTNACRGFVHDISVIMNTDGSENKNAQWRMNAKKVEYEVLADGIVMLRILPKDESSPFRDENSTKIYTFADTHNNGINNNCAASTCSGSSSPLSIPSDSSISNKRVKIESECDSMSNRSHKMERERSHKMERERRAAEIQKNQIAHQLEMQREQIARQMEFRQQHKAVKMEQVTLQHQKMTTNTYVPLVQLPTSPEPFPPMPESAFMMAENPLQQNSTICINRRMSVEPVYMVNPLVETPSYSMQAYMHSYHPIATPIIPVQHQIKTEIIQGTVTGTPPMSFGTPVSTPLLSVSPTPSPVKISKKRGRKATGNSIPGICNVAGCFTNRRGLVKVDDKWGKAGLRCGVHGAGVRCAIEGCSKQFQIRMKEADKFGPPGPRCKTHGGNKQCIVEGCTTNYQGTVDRPDEHGAAGPRCCRHGGRRKCSLPHCGTPAQGHVLLDDALGVAGLRCKKHGAMGKLCSVPDCKVPSKRLVTAADEFGAPGLRCSAHNGRVLCSLPGCDKVSRSKIKEADKYGEPGYRCNAHHPHFSPEDKKVIKPAKSE